MSDNSQQTQIQTDVNQSEQMVGLVPLQTEETNIGVQLIGTETDGNFFGSQAIELNGERHVIVSQAQDPETGELLLVLRGENGEHIAIQSDALSSMVQASGGEQIQVAVVSQTDETPLTLTSDISSLSHPITTPDVNPISTTLTALPSIIANIPSQTQTSSAPTNVVQAIDTPIVSKEEQPSISTNTSSPATKPETEITTDSTIPTKETQTVKKKETEHVLNNEKTSDNEKTSEVKESDDKNESQEKEIKSSINENTGISQQILEVKESVEQTEVLKADETKPKTTEVEKSVEINSISEKSETKCEIEMPFDKDIEKTSPTKESVEPITSTSTTASDTTTSSITAPEGPVGTESTPAVESAPDLDFSNTAVIQVQDSGNQIEQLMANAVMTTDGSYVLMATEDGQVTGLPPDLNLSDVISAGGAGQTFLIETPEGLVACTASTSGEDGAIQLIPTEAGDIESAVISTAQTSGNLVDNQLIQAISGGQAMSYTFNSNSGCLELTAVDAPQSQSPTKSARSRGSRAPKSKTITPVTSMGKTLLLSTDAIDTNSPTITTKQSTPASARSRGGRGKGGRSGGAVNSTMDSTTDQTLKTNTKTVFSTTGSLKSSLDIVNNLSAVTSAPTGASQLAASRRTYSKKTNIVWITPDASQGPSNTPFATVATASVVSSKPSPKATTITSSNLSPTKTIPQSMSSSSRVRTPSPTKTTPSTAPLTSVNQVTTQATSAPTIGTKTMVKSTTVPTKTAVKTKPSTPSKVQTPNLSIKGSANTKIESVSKTQIRVSDITATKSSASTPSLKTMASKTIVTVSSPTKSKTIASKSGATTISITSPIKSSTSSTDKSGVSSTTSTTLTANSTPKPILSTSLTKSSPIVSTSEKSSKGILSPTMTSKTSLKSSNPVSKDSIKETVEGQESPVKDLKVTTIDKTSSARSMETRHSSRLSPLKSIKTDTFKEVVTKTSTDSEEKSLKPIEETKQKSVSEKEMKNKSKIESNVTESQTVLTLKSIEKTSNDIEKTESIDTNKSVRKSRRNSKNNLNDMKNINEIETNETKTEELTEKILKTNKNIETPTESVTTRRTSSRKREISISKNDNLETLSTPTAGATPTDAQSSSGRVTRTGRAGKASSVKKPETKSTKADEKESKSVVKTDKEKESKTNEDLKFMSDFDRIVEQTKTPKVESTPQSTKIVAPNNAETIVSNRSVKKKVKFEINDKIEDNFDDKTKEKTPELSAPKRRSLRSSTPQAIEGKPEDESFKSNVSENENYDKTPQRFSTRKRKEVPKAVSVEPEVKRTKSTKQLTKPIANSVEDINSSVSSTTGRLRDRKLKDIKFNERRFRPKASNRYSLESSDPFGRINRNESLIQSYVDENEWQEKEENLRRNTISSLSDLRSPNESYDYSTNECSFYIRHQSTSVTPKQSAGNYLCQKCGFHTTRINNLVVHHRDQCSYIKNAVIQQWQTELQKRVKPSDPSSSRMNSKRRKVEPFDEKSNNSLNGSEDESEDDCNNDSVKTNDKTNENNPTISDIDAMLMADDDDEDLLAIDNNSVINDNKREFGFTEDDIVWVETNGTHWPALVSKVFSKEKKTLVKLIDSPWTKKSLKVNIDSIESYDCAEVNKKYVTEGRKGSIGEALVKAVQKSEEFLRKKFLGNDLSAAKFFEQLDSDLSEATADEDERHTTTNDDMSNNSKEIPKTSKESALENNLPITGTNGSDVEVDRIPENNEAIAQWKEKRRQQNAKLLQCIKEGKVETHLLGVYRESIASERHLKFRSGSESEKNQLKHVPWFGPIDDEEQQEDIYDYCSQLFKANFKTDGSFDTVAYIFEVWVPEAIVKAISRVRRIELKDSEVVFAKGVILSKSEKDELNKEIQKEAEKQLTSHTSSD